MKTEKVSEELDVYKRQVMDYGKCREVKHILEEIIDKDKDSLRFYYLGNNYQGKIEHIGAKETFSVEAPLII